MLIPVINKTVSNKNKNTSAYKIYDKTNKQKKFEPVDFSNLPVFEFFKNVYENDNMLNTYSLTTIKDVRAEFLNRKPKGYWTLERCMESAKIYSLPAEWKIGDNDAYQAAVYYDWYKKCIEHMTIIYRIQDMCMRNALRYNKLRIWKRKEKVVYKIALKYGYIDLCTKHMIA
jgi:hypothetical protein